MNRVARVEGSMRNLELSPAGISARCDAEAIVNNPDEDRLDSLKAVAVCLALSLGLWTAILLPFLL